MATSPEDIQRIADAVATRLAERRPLRLAVSLDEAAEAIGVSRDHLNRHVLPHVRVSMIGRRRVLAVRELELYLERQAV